jgi:antitoxin component YwqK of YwqJK toxin-antitoxin module
MSYRVFTIRIYLKIRAIEVFESDLMNGLQKYFYDNGEVRMTKNYRNGHLDGELKVFYKDGVKMFEGTIDHSAGKEYQSFYYPDGKLE